MAMQKRFAGINPVCVVRTAIVQIIALLTPATIQPCHILRPTITVEAIVNKQEM
jgi:hypothetical protein